MVRKMGIKELFLAPFSVLQPPQINTPFSTIKLPPFYVTMSLVFASYLIISGGAIFSHVKQVPFIAATRNSQGQTVPQIIGNSRTQTWLESIIVGTVFTLAASSLIAAYMSFDSNNNEKSKDNNKKKKGVDPDSITSTEMFGYTFPLWIFVLFYLFKAKYGFFAPGFFARR